ncbi:MAG: M42 family metallopeptidase [Candidatus Sumerlaeia bacterium]|nr:M42 family metallopeptidase [Candidatus Sumerlaeia bacterium]
MSSLIRPESLDFLRRLLTTPSPSGFEREAQQLWIDYVAPYADGVTSDVYGNVVATLNPGAPTSILVEGHCDEIGLMVAHIDDSGFIYSKSIGGIDAAVVPGKRLRIHGAKGTVLGVTGATAIHLRDKDKAAEVRKLHELFIDIGAKSADEVKERGVRVGDAMTFADDFELLTEHLCVARALDNRIGTWVAAETLRTLKESGAALGVTVHAASCVQEEVGLRGAQMITTTLKPDMALVTDVGHATDSPGIDHRLHGKVKLGEGPILSFGGAMHPEMTKRLLAVAEEIQVPLQREAEPGGSGTDADMTFKTSGGCATALLGLPIRYMHTTVEMTDLRDLQRIVELYVAFIRSLNHGERITVPLNIPRK